MATYVTQANKEIAASGQATGIRVTQSPIEILVSAAYPQTPSLRVTQSPIEVLTLADGFQPPTSSLTLVTQATKEIAASGQTTSLRVTQSPIEILVSAAYPQTPSLRVTQNPLEILVLAAGSVPPTALRVTQAPIEVLVSVATQVISMEDSDSIPGGDVLAPTVVLQPTQMIVMGTSDSIPEGDVPAPTVSLMATPPPPPPVFYHYPSGGGKGAKWRPVETDADVMLREKQKAWKSFVESWSKGQEGLRGLGRISNGLRWLVMGRQRRPFFKQGSIVTPSPADLDVPVVDFTVPEGYYGWISGFWWAYTGTGYEDGSNDLHWRIRIGDAYPDGYGDVRYQMGTATDPILITGMIPLRSRSRVQLLVFVQNDSGAIQVGASRIIGGLTGWFYEPERTAGEKGIRW